MNKKGVGIIFIIILAVVVVGFLVWGYLGGQEAKQVGVTCDMGLGSFCWKWHTNIIGQTGQVINNIFSGK